MLFCSNPPSVSSKRTFAQVRERGAEQEKCEHSWSTDIIMTALAGLQGAEAERSLVFEVGERSLGFLIYTLATADTWKGHFLCADTASVEGGHKRGKGTN